MRGRLSLTTLDYDNPCSKDLIALVLLELAPRLLAALPAVAAIADVVSGRFAATAALLAPASAAHRLLEVAAAPAATYTPRKRIRVI